MVYLNISDETVGEDGFKFSVFVSSGDYQLRGKNPVLIGCKGECYEIVAVVVEDESQVIHQGIGYISELTDKN